MKLRPPIIAVLLNLSCTRAEQELVSDARFGVFFGGQLQERKELPFELEPTRLRPGFRLEFETPPKTDLDLVWEVSRPGQSTTGDVPPDPVRRVTELQRGRVPRGSQRFDRDVLFRPGDPLGLWNIRVVLDDRVLIDRPFLVYDAAARKRAARAARAALGDAGL